MNIWQGQYIMLKDKTVNGERRNLYRHPRYTDEQIKENESELPWELFFIKTMYTSVRTYGESLSLPILTVQNPMASEQLGGPSYKFCSAKGRAAL